MSLSRAISAVERKGILLVFPLENRAEPPSLWSELHPRSRMKWEWDDDGDDRVAQLWHLRTELSESRRVIYSKWYRGRATCLSPAAFVAARRLLNPEGDSRTRAAALPEASARALEVLELDSPLSTKQLKAATGLEGRLNEAEYGRALKPLWERLLIVGFGEVDDGAFPSLAIGSARALFEELCARSDAMTEAGAEQALGELLPEGSLFLRLLARLRAKRGRS